MVADITETDNKQFLQTIDELQRHVAEARALAQAACAADTVPRAYLQAFDHAANKLLH